MRRQAWSLIAVNPLSNWPRTSCGSTPGSTWPPAAFRLSLPRWFQYLRRWQATIVAGFTKISVSRQSGHVLVSHAGGCGPAARYEDAYRISGTPRTGVDAPGVPWAAVQRPPFLLTRTPQARPFPRHVVARPVQVKFLAAFSARSCSGTSRIHRSPSPRRTTSQARRPSRAARSAFSSGTCCAILPQSADDWPAS